MPRSQSSFRQGADDGGGGSGGSNTSGALYAPDEGLEQGALFAQGEHLGQGYVIPEEEAAEEAPAEDEGGGGFWGGLAEKATGVVTRVGEIARDPSEIWNGDSVVQNQAESAASAGGGGLGGAISATYQGRLERAQVAAGNSIPTTEQVGQEIMDSYGRSASGFAELITNPGPTWDLINSPTQWMPTAKLIAKEYKAHPDDFFADLATGATLSAATAGVGAVAAKGVSKIGRGGAATSKVVDDVTEAARLLPDADGTAEAAQVAAQAGERAAAAAPRAAAFQQSAVRAASHFDGAAAADDAVRAAPAGLDDVATKPSWVERFDTKRNAQVERRLQRRSNFAPSNIVRRALPGVAQKDLSYTWGQRKMSQFGDWVAGGADDTGSPNALRQWAGKSLSRTETKPIFPEGTNRALEAYKTAQWRNQQIMRPVNKARAVSGIGEDVEKANEVAGIAADPRGYLMDRFFGQEPEQQGGSIYDDEEEITTAPQTRWRPPAAVSTVRAPASQSYGQQEYRMGRGY